MFPVATITGVLGALIMFVGYVSALTYVPLQIGTSIFARRHIRWLSLAPVPFAIFIAVITFQAWQQQSNLWPICALFVCPIFIVHLLACIAAESSQRRSDPTRTESLRDMRRRTGLCEDCGYDMFGTPSDRCPECGCQRQVRVHR